MKQTKTITAKVKAPRPSTMRQVPGKTTLLQVDLWMGAPDDPLNSSEISHPSAAAAQMIGDLVGVTNGELHTCSDSAISASYKNARQAVAAVRHMQHLIRGFSSAGQSTSLHTSFRLHHADDVPTNGDVPAANANRAEVVLLTGTLCAEAKSIPGLRFKDTPSSSHKGPGKVLELLPPVHSSESKLVAFAPPPPPKVAAPVASVEPQSPATSFHKVDRTQPRPSLQPKIAAAVARAAQIAQSLGSSHRFRIGGGVALGLAVLITLGITLKPFAKFKPAAAASTSPTAPVAHPIPAATQTSPISAPPPDIQKNTTPTPVSSALTPEQPRTPSPLTPNTVAAAPPKAKPTPRDAAPAAPSLPQVTYSASDINVLLSRAERLSGDGHYEDAINLFKAVLRQDRKNTRAQEGLERAIHNQDQQ